MQLVANRNSPANDRISAANRDSLSNIQSGTAKAKPSQKLQTTRHSGFDAHRLSYFL